MVCAGSIEALEDFLGSARIFTAAVDELLADQLRGTAPTCVTLPQLKVLQFVARAHSHTIGTLASFLGVSNAAASKTVQRLVQHGHLRRTEAPHDRRAIHLTLTDEGWRVLRQFHAARDGTLERLLGECAPEELRRATELMDHLSLTILREDADRDMMCFRCGIHLRRRCLLEEREGRACGFFHERPAVQASTAHDTSGSSAMIPNAKKPNGTSSNETDQGSRRGEKET